MVKKKNEKANHLPLRATYLIQNWGQDGEQTQAHLYLSLFSCTVFFADSVSHRGPCTCIAICMVA